MAPSFRPAGKKSSDLLIDYKFNNGLEVKGTIKQIEKIASTMKLKVDYKSIGIRPKGYYQSASKGLVKISTMNDHHIRRALLKRAKEYYAEIYDQDDSILTFLERFTSLVEDSLIIDLFTELSNRK